MVRLTAIAMAALFVAAPIAQAQQHILGDYYAYGRNADGTAYSGTVEILPNGPNQVIVNWSVGSSYSGIGTLSGDVLTVEWGANHPAFYIVMSDGELHGTWGDGEGLELLSRNPR
ncbi:hypothetical protein V8J82_04115 [Gymnodinialimonas sp. 2305UL16-5]|uniref:hypothetical protein n=1 Tax=Gymnodinialimonas mytili TaxID=3126503 RepID=UPI0030A0E078